MEVIKYVDREVVKVVEKPVEVIKYVDREVVKVVEKPVEVIDTSAERWSRWLRSRWK